jgi:uncharacterized protein (TIGR03435 family)
MTNSIACLGLAAFTCAAAFSQPAADAQPTFEVASVKPANPPAVGPHHVGCNGGPDSRDPGLLTCENMSTYNLLTMAYDVMRFRISGPDWMDSTLFDITARIPPGTTRERLRLMEQNLLAERFKLALHHEKKEMDTYEMAVAKNGPKLKESAPPPKGDDPAQAKPAWGPLKLGTDGFPVLPPNSNVMAIMMPGRARRQQFGETIDHFAQFLSSSLGRPVTDATGLTGKYDIVLSWATDMGLDGRPLVRPVGTPSSEGNPPDPSESLPTLIQAVQSLGLKLEPKKGLVDILVIDHIEKTPVEN